MRRYSHLPIACVAFLMAISGGATQLRAGSALASTDEGFTGNVDADGGSSDFWAHSYMDWPVVAGPNQSTSYSATFTPPGDKPTTIRRNPSKVYRRNFYS